MKKQLISLKLKLLIAFGLCMMLMVSPTAGQATSEYTSIECQKGPHFNLSNTEGTVGKSFHADIIIERGEVIDQLQILSVVGLPPGLTYNEKTLSIEGTPTKAGTYKIITKYNDKVKGSIKYGPGGYYTNHTEVVISN